MNAIFHNDQEAYMDEIIREMAQHINWLKQQPNANVSTIQQRGKWLHAIIAYRASMKAVVEEYAAQPAALMHHEGNMNTTSEAIRTKRWWDWEGTREETIKMAMEAWPQLY